MVTVVGDLGVQFPRFRARLCLSDTAPVSVEREELWEAVGSCGGAAASPVTWRA